MRPATAKPSIRRGPNMRKRSVTLGGHATSVSLEDQYWAELKRMAADAGITLAALVARIDRNRPSGNLSSALRLAVLDDLKAKLSKPAIAEADPGSK
jgi:predicted DNA-binding ribbon-helix-helix protein